MSNKNDNLYKEALKYHNRPNGPGKIEIVPTKEVVTSYDLSLAYSPGVAAPCLEIQKDPSKVNDYTARGNLVAIITNGTAVLGLGNIGPLASKPVMEGKAVLFKKFAGINAFDIEIDELDVDKFVDTVARLEPSFGGINLEDIKAPECFAIEEKLKERLNIPVLHDDQHGTAIIVCAAFKNWLRLSGKKVEDVKLVASGAGAAALACLSLLVKFGLPMKNIIVTDIHGVVYKGRLEEMDEKKSRFAIETEMRSLNEAITGADVFLGLSAAGVLKPEMVQKMADEPLIMALANPNPEITPEEALKANPKAIIATGRTDYPNQVNNVLGFPYIFRGALDVGATTINEEMKLACVDAIADLALDEITEEVADAYAGEDIKFGRDYLIPKPFDPRLILSVPMAVAKAAMDTGVAARPIADFKEYKKELEKYVFKSGQLMRPIYTRASEDAKRVAFAEGEETKILRAVQSIVDDNVARPILIGREEVIEFRIKKAGLRLQKGRDFELVNPENDPRYEDYWKTYHELRGRDGISPSTAKKIIRTSNTTIASLLVYKGDADAIICGTTGRYKHHLEHISAVIEKEKYATSFAAMSILITDKGTFFICDTHVNPNPTAEQICSMTIQAAREVRRFGLEPNVALLSHSDFGISNSPDALKMKQAVEMIKEIKPDLNIDGEMNADCALSVKNRNLIYPNSTLKGQANLLIMPNIDAANIAYNMTKVLSNAIVIGPLLLGSSKPAYILTPSSSSKGIANVAALASVKAQMIEERIKSAKNG